MTMTQDIRDPFALRRNIISILFPLVRGCRPGKPVQMTEAEVRGLCLKSREIFLSQPILLELEAPLKICGKVQNVFVSQELGPGN